MCTDVQHLIISHATRMCTTSLTNYFNPIFHASCRERSLCRESFRYYSGSPWLSAIFQSERKEIWSSFPRFALFCFNFLIYNTCMHLKFIRSTCYQLTPIAFFLFFFNFFIPFHNVFVWRCLGRFKKPISFAHVYTGQAYDTQINHIPAKWLVNTGLQFMSKLQPAHQACLQGNRPHILSPLVSTAQKISMFCPDKIFWYLSHILLMIIYQLPVNYNSIFDFNTLHSVFYMHSQLLFSYCHCFFFSFLFFNKYHHI